MQPYQTAADETTAWPATTSETWAAWAASIVAAPGSNLPISAYHNIASSEPDEAGQRDVDYFILRDLPVGHHRLHYLPDALVAQGVIVEESAGGITLYELVQHTFSQGPPVYGLKRWPTVLRPDIEAVDLSDAEGGFIQTVDFYASAPGEPRDYTWDPLSDRFRPQASGLTHSDGYIRSYTTGIFVAEAAGTAFDAAVVDMSLSFPQTGAGRYLLSLDQYEGARDAAWGADWLEVAGEPETGILAISDLDWVRSASGTWSATGAATIGLKEAGQTLLRVGNGSFLLSDTGLSFTGDVASIIENAPARPLFSGSAVLALATATGTISPDPTGAHRLTLAGLPCTLDALQLQPGAVVLRNAAFDLPADFADVPVRVDEIEISISRNGVMLDNGTTAVGIGFLRLLNLVDVKPSYFAFTYDRTRDEIAVGGKLQIGEDSFFPRPLDASIAGNIRIRDGTVSEGKLEIDGILGIKGYGFEDLELTLDAAANAGRGAITGSGKLLLPFPSLFQIDEDGLDHYDSPTDFYPGIVAGGENGASRPDTWGIGARIEFTTEPVALDGIEVSAILPTGIPFFSTPFEIREIGAGLDNFSAANAEAVSFSGLLGLEGIAGRIFDTRIDLQGEVSKNRFEGGLKGHFIDPDRVSFEGTGKLDWVADVFEASLQMSFLDSLIEASLELRSTFDLDATARGQASFELLGARVDGNVYLRIQNDDDASNDYVAAWGSVRLDLPFLGARMISRGIKYTFDGGAPTSFGAADVPAYASWVVDASTADLMVTVAWERPAAGPVDTRVIVYDDLQKTRVREIIGQADYAAHGIAVIPQWSGPLGTVIYIAAPEPGLWDVEVLDPEALGEIRYSASTSLAPGTLRLDALARDGASVTIDFTAIAPDGQSTVLFFADDDPTGFNGIAIGSVAESDGAGRFVWNATGFATGWYWLYALMEDGRHIPLEAYADAPLRIGAPAAPIVGTPGADTLAGTPGNDTIEAGAGHDTIAGGAGNDQLAGGPGIDSARYDHAHASAQIVAVGSSIEVRGPGGTDTLNGIERLQFTDRKLAFDLLPQQSAGQAALALGVLLPAGLASPPIIGLVMSFTDSGMDVTGFCQWLDDNGILAALAGSRSAHAIARMAADNVLRLEAPASVIDALAATMDGRIGTLTPAQFLGWAAATEFNQIAVDLVGLQQSGMAFA